MTIFEMLEDRHIVLLLPEDNVIVTWNESLTLQYFFVKGDKFEEIDICTLSEMPKSTEEARMKAYNVFRDRVQENILYANC